MLRVCLLALALVAIGLSQNINADGWYPQYGTGAVDAGSSDFRFVLEYLKAKTGLGEPKLVVEQFADTTANAPYTLRFPCPNSGVMAVVDAVPAFYHPEIAVIDLERSCGLPLTRPAPYVKPAPPPPAKVRPTKITVLVGAAYEGTDGHYMPVVGDNSPDGAVYRDKRGTFIKVMRATPFGNSVYWQLVKF